MRAENKDAGRSPAADYHGQCVRSNCLARPPPRQNRQKGTHDGAMEPAVYLSQGRFHRSIRCHRTQARVTFALIGDWGPGAQQTSTAAAAADGSVVLYILPSGCSRYVGILLDGIARAKNVRMVAIDRPGAGGTVICPPKDRMRIATAQTQSVLEHLQITRLDLLTQSSGWFYALQLIVDAPHYFLPPAHRATRLVFSSPFVPTHISGSLLSLLPANVVSLTPVAASVLGSIGKALSWSSGFVPSAWFSGQDKDVARTQRKKQTTREKSIRRRRDARFHPPYDPHLELGLDAWKAAKGARSDTVVPRHPRTGRTLKSGDELLFDYFTLEGCVHGVVEDFLFCLGKVDGMSSEALDQWTSDTLNQAATVLASPSAAAATAVDRRELPKPEHARKSAEVVIVWGEKDLLIPAKGQRYLKQMVEDAFARHSSLSVQEWMLADGGHDTALTSKEVLDDALGFLHRAAQPDAAV